VEELEKNSNPPTKILGKDKLGYTAHQEEDWLVTLGESVGKILFQLTKSAGNFSCKILPTEKIVGKY
jgi:hypothetical protein